MKFVTKVQASYLLSVYNLFVFQDNICTYQELDDIIHDVAIPELSFG